MKITTPIEICNVALLRLEQNTISSFDRSEDNSIASLSCSLTYDQSRQALLSSYPWSFSIKSAKLAISRSDHYSPIYKNFYSLPADFLRLVSAFDSSRLLSPSIGSVPPYAIRGKYLASNSSNISIDYVWDLDDVSAFSPTFKNSLALDISLRLAPLFKSSSSVVQTIQQELFSSLSKAKISDCSQNPLPNYTPSSLLSTDF